MGTHASWDAVCLGEATNGPAGQDLVNVCVFFVSPELQEVLMQLNAVYVKVLAIVVLYEPAQKVVGRQQNSAAWQLLICSRATAQQVEQRCWPWFTTTAASLCAWMMRT